MNPRDFGLIGICVALLMGLIVATATPTSAADAPATKGISEAAVKDLVKYLSKNVEDALKKADDAAKLDGEEKSKVINRSAGVVRSNAMMTALAAQSAMGQDKADVKKLATLRDVAVKFSETAKADLRNPKLDTKAASAQLEIIAKYPDIKADDNAKTDKRKWNGTFELNDVMRPFQGKAMGGLGLDKEFDELAKGRKPPTAAKMTDQLVPFAYMTALLADACIEFDQERAKGKEKLWRELTDEMRQHALALAEASAAKKGDQALTAVKQLHANCGKCHLELRK